VQVNPGLLLIPKSKNPQSRMGQYSVGEALNLLLVKSAWKPKVTELRLRAEWEAIVGRTVAKYTRTISLRDRTLTIVTDIAALKQELHFGKAALIASINAHMGETLVSDIVVK
jgi:predicted nucleic acid-binding Zn ribbon protein